MPIQHFLFSSPVTIVAVALQNPTKLDRQRSQRLAPPRRRAIPIDSIGNSGNGALEQVARRDALGGPDNGVIESRGRVSLVVQGGEEAGGDGALARGFWTVDD